MSSGSGVLTSRAVLGRVAAVLVAMLVTGFGAGLVPGSSAAASGSLLPTIDPFYHWSGAITHDATGTDDLEDTNDRL
jgi:hypothetical protein